MPHEIDHEIEISPHEIEIEISPHEIDAELRSAEAEHGAADPTHGHATGGAGGAHERGGAVGSLWSELVSFSVGALRPAGGGTPADETFASLLSLLCQLLEAAPSLIDRAWYLLVKVLAPAGPSLALDPDPAPGPAPSREPGP